MTEKQKKTRLQKFVKLIKDGQAYAKVAAIAAATASAVLAFFSSSSVTTGAALGAAGVSALAATKATPKAKYERVRHVPPQTRLVGRVARKNGRRQGPSREATQKADQELAALSGAMMPRSISQSPRS